MRASGQRCIEEVAEEDDVSPQIHGLVVVARELQGSGGLAGSHKIKGARQAYVIPSSATWA